MRDLGNMLRAICVAFLLGHSHLASPASSSHWSDVAGYQVDMRLTPKSQMAETVENLKHQIGIVDAVNLPNPVQSFFHTLKIVIDPSLTEMNGRIGQINGEWVIRARPGSWPSDRAILLHELLHAYQRQVLGMPTPAVGRALQEALREGTYPLEYQGSYFLSNGGEYFAVVGEIYLAGPSFRPPYNCRNVQQAQPDVIRYLATLFGEHDCR